jgi:malonyl-CoA decarboxylase
MTGRARVRVSSTPESVLELFTILAQQQEPPSILSLTRQAVHGYRALDPNNRLAVLKQVAEFFGPDQEALQAAIAAYSANSAETRFEAIHSASESRRQQLLRRLSLVPGAIAFLIEMRGDVLKHAATVPELTALDNDLLRVFRYWFNGGLITLRRLESSSPAKVLKQLIEHEAVHEMKGWGDLWRRLDPPDRRCYGLFHPGLPDSPLIFLEVALTTDVPRSITPVLAEKREPIAAEAASTAVFYSISNCQPGLGGIRFGNYLLMQVMELLAAELPNLKTFITLSPIPGFAGWLRSARAEDRAVITDVKERLAALDDPLWAARREYHGALAPALLTAAARYVLWERTSANTIIDPVARFHLGNGARMEALHFLADSSPKGLRQGCGVMVNYLYDRSSLERNCLLFSQRNIAVASVSIRKLAGKGLRRRKRSGDVERA